MHEETVLKVKIKTCTVYDYVSGQTYEDRVLCLEPVRRAVKDPPPVITLIKNTRGRYSLN